MVFGTCGTQKHRFTGRQQNSFFSIFCPNTKKIDSRWRHEKMKNNTQLKDGTIPNIWRDWCNWKFCMSKWQLFNCSFCVLFRTVLIENLRSLIKSSTDRFQREVRTYLGCGEIKVGSLECGKNRERVFFRGGVLVLTKFSGHIWWLDCPKNETFGEIEVFYFFSFSFLKVFSDLFSLETCGKLIFIRELVYRDRKKIRAGSSHKSDFFACSCLSFFSQSKYRW